MLDTDLRFTLSLYAMSIPEGLSAYRLPDIPNLVARIIDTGDLQAMKQSVRMFRYLGEHPCESDWQQLFGRLQTVLDLTPTYGVPAVHVPTKPADVRP